MIPGLRFLKHFVLGPRFTPQQRPLSQQGFPLKQLCPLLSLRPWQPLPQPPSQQILQQGPQLPLPQPLRVQQPLRSLVLQLLLRPVPPPLTRLPPPPGLPRQQVPQRPPLRGSRRPAPPWSQQRRTQKTS